MKSLQSQCTLHSATAYSRKAGRLGVQQDSMSSSGKAYKRCHICSRAQGWRPPRACAPRFSLHPTSNPRPRPHLGAEGSPASLWGSWVFFSRLISFPLFSSLLFSHACACMICMHRHAGARTSMHHLLLPTPYLPTGGVGGSQSAQIRTLTSTGGEGGRHCPPLPPHPTSTGGRGGERKRPRGGRGRRAP